MQTYSDPARESNPHALPDVEVFHVSADEFLQAEAGTWQAGALVNAADDGTPYNQQRTETAAESLAGWYWWTCLSGCLPDGDPSGPFETETLALADAQSEAEGGAA